MNLDFIKSPQKREITLELKEQFGITELPYLLIQSSKGKIKGYSGHLSKQEIQEINNLTNVEILGLYLIRQEHDLRLSLDATHLLSKQITKNIIEIDNEQAINWIKGNNINIKKPSGTYVVKYKNYLLGCGKSNSEVILNHVPKERRLKK